MDKKLSDDLDPEKISEHWARLERIRQIRSTGKQKELNDQLQALHESFWNYLTTYHSLFPEFVTIWYHLPALSTWLVISRELDNKEELTEEDIAEFGKICELVKTEFGEYRQLIQSPPTNHEGRSE